MKQIRKRIGGVLLACIMALTLMPATALAADGVSTPSASGNAFFANGTHITITDSVPDGATEVTFSGDAFKESGTDAYISWEDDNLGFVSVGVSKNVYVFGGGNGSSSPVTIPRTSITMTGGEINSLYGGSYGTHENSAESCSVVTGDVYIDISGSAVIRYLLHGGGYYNAAVNGTVYMHFSNVDLSDPENYLYVCGGTYGDGGEGSRLIEEGKMDTAAVVNKVVITAEDSQFSLLGAGGSGSTKVNSAEVDLNGCKVDSLYLSGINGEVETVDLTMTNCTVNDFSATNRGFVGTAEVNIQTSNITKLNTGAGNGCFSTDSGTPDGSGITGSSTWNIDADSEVGSAQLTPLVVRTGNSSNPDYATTYQNLTIQRAGEPLEMAVSDFSPVYESDGETPKVTLRNFSVPAGSTLALKGVTATVEADNMLTNAGTITMDSASSLTVSEDSTFQDAGGTVTGGTFTNYGTEKTYVAKIGSDYYEDLQSALNAAALNNGTVELLRDVTVSVPAGTSEKTGALNITGSLKLDGKGFTISANTEDGTFTEDANVVGNFHLLNITGGTVELNNLKLDGKDVTRHGINVFTADGASSKTTVTLNTVESRNNNGYGLVSGGSVVTVNGLTTSGNGWGGVNVDNTNSSAQGGSLTMNSGSIQEPNSLYVQNSKTGVTENGPEAIIAGGTFEGYVSIEQSGGADLPGTDLTVSGGNFAYPVDEKYLDATVEAQLQKASGTAPYSYYDDLDDAIAAAGEGDKVTAVGATPEDLVTVTLKYNDDTSADTVYTVPATTQISLPTPRRGSYTFEGWYVGGSKVSGSYTVPTENVTLEARWTKEVEPSTPSSDSSDDGDYSIRPSGTSSHGSVIINPSWADKGDTVTLTVKPNDGYELGKLTVLDKSGDEIRVTAKGDNKYTFTMPAGNVTVEASFVRSGAQDTLPFVDVAADAYYYDAVKWAIENDVTQGVTATAFQPNSSCTRAQTVTFLWRAAGSPAPETTVNPFTDVSASDYYYEAVLWAVENGITQGTTATTFGPGIICTRAQVVTFLYRYSEEEAETASSFSDVAADAYYAGAVNWAVENGVTQGVTATAFQPNSSCTRAQIVTFLYRYMG